MTGSALWIAHACSVWFMTGLIWLVQCVQYPLFLRVGVLEFPEFHRYHSAWITPVVGPVMLVQLATAVLLATGAPAGAAPDNITQLDRWVCLALTLAVFGVTAFLSVPAHNQLATGGWNREVIEHLIRTNWLRTFAWSLNSGWMVRLAVRVLN